MNQSVSLLVEVFNDLLPAIVTFGIVLGILVLAYGRFHAWRTRSERIWQFGLVILAVSLVIAALQKL